MRGLKFRPVHAQRVKPFPVDLLIREEFTPRKGIFWQQYDPEMKLYVAQRADAMAREMKHTPFRRGLFQRKAIKKTLYDTYGKPLCEVHVHDSGVSEHQYDNYQDAVARPDPAVMEARVAGPRPVWS